MVIRYMKAKVVEWVNERERKRGIDIVFNRGELSLSLVSGEKLGLEFWWNQGKSLELCWRLSVDYKKWLESGSYTATYKVFRIPTGRESDFYPLSRTRVESFSVGLDRTLYLPEMTPFSPIVRFYENRTFDLFFFGERIIKVLTVEFPEKNPKVPQVKNFPRVREINSEFDLPCQNGILNFKLLLKG